MAVTGREPISAEGLRAAMDGLLASDALRKIVEGIVEDAMGPVGQSISGTVSVRAPEKMSSSSATGTIGVTSSSEAFSCSGSAITVKTTGTYRVDVSSRVDDGLRLDVARLSMRVGDVSYSLGELGEGDSSNFSQTIRISAGTEVAFTGSGTYAGVGSFSATLVFSIVGA